ncbi:sporulation peptidase YabG [Gorillibacterium sp. sgz5001074]|uniref:sporulation peptidase YabG n=1 Tax=Gorillibacterium sp. sgz5001074 TaxID=3446695 RepID=UPI003F67EDB9
MKQGDLVVRKSYGGDVIFKIQEFTYQTALLRGIDYRLLADASVADLVPASQTLLDEHEQDMQRKSDEMRSWMTREQPAGADRRSARGGKPDRNSYPYFEVPGKVLHLDGDPNYLRKSMALYGELRVPAEGIYVPETNMADALVRLLPQVKPDIVVVTGHDGILKERKDASMQSLNSYKNSQNFVNAVRVARQYERNRDSLVVIAGACQSHFEALLQAGANYASSPGRVLIHALDPLYIAAKVAFTSIKDTVPIMDVLQHTMSGLDGLGGIETRGSHRMGLPKLKQP